MLHAYLIHTCDIETSQHTLVGRKKTPNWVSSDTDVECRIMPLSDAAAFTIMGRTAIETYTGIFQAGTVLKVGDKVLWKDRSPTQTFLVEGAREMPLGPDEAQEHHVEAVLKLQNA